MRFYKKYLIKQIPEVFIEDIGRNITETTNFPTFLKHSWRPFIESPWNLNSKSSSRLNTHQSLYKYIQIVHIIYTFFNVSCID